MKRNTYIDFLAYYGIGSAHPGGFTLTKQVLAQMPLGMHANVLEVGCGTGRTAAYMSQVYGYQVTAVENNEMMIQKARDRWLAQGLSIDLIQGKVEQLPCKDETFELVLGESILAFTNKEQSIPECYRVLQNNGKLVVIEMVLESPLDKEAETTILQLYGMEELLTETEWIHLFQKSKLSAYYRWRRWYNCRNGCESNGRTRMECITIYSRRTLSYVGASMNSYCININTC